MTVPFVHSGYVRKKDDDYQTIDRRCVHALLDTWDIQGKVVDCCAPNGSGIIDAFKEWGDKEVYDISNIQGIVDFPGAWVVTNPPYKRPVVDDIANAVVAMVHIGSLKGAAFLMRANWDFAQSRAHLFSLPSYRGQTRMRFRPWWTEEREAQPIHNFVWHVWTKGGGEPVVRYWPKHALISRDGKLVPDVVSK